MKRQIIKIDQNACTGCGLCVTACQEGAIAMVNGKACLIRDDYCDGLGNCLPNCPASAISFEIREAAAYDEEAVKTHLARRGCAGAAEQTLKPADCSSAVQQKGGPQTFSNAAVGNQSSELRQWPVQIKLVPTNAAFFNNADLLIAADCTAYAFGDFHQRFMAGRVAVIGCTKLDNADYSDKLADIFCSNNIRSVTVVRMDVPCCGGMTNAVHTALAKSGKSIPCKVYTVSRDGTFFEGEQNGIAGKILSMASVELKKCKQRG